MSVLSRFLSIFTSRLGSILLRLFITPVLARILGQAGYGDYAFLMSVFVITMSFTNSGIFDSVRKYIAEGSDEPAWETHVFAFYLRLGVVFGVAALAILAAVAALLPFEFPGASEFQLYLILVGLMVLTVQVQSVTRSGLMGLGLERYSEPLNFLLTVLFAVVGLPLAYIGFGVSGVLVGRIVAAMVVGTVGFHVLSNHINLSATLERPPEWFSRRRLLDYNVATTVFILLTASLYHVDIVLIRTMLGGEVTGYYKAALALAEFLWLVPHVLQITLLHSTSRLWSQGQLDRISELLAQSIRVSVLVVSLLAAGLFVLAEPFVTLYFGAAFKPAVVPLLILIPGAVGFSIARPVFAVGQASGNLRPLIAATGISAVLNLVLNLALIPRLGTTGAAIATSTSYGLMVMFHAIAAYRLGYWPTSDIRPGRVLLTVLLSVVTLVLLDHFVPSQLSLFVVPPVGAAVHLFIAVATGAITRDEIKSLFSRTIEWR